MCVQALKQHKYCLPSIIRIKIGTMCVGSLLISINSYDSLGDIYAILVFERTFKFAINNTNNYFLVWHTGRDHILLRIKVGWLGFSLPI